MKAKLLVMASVFLIAGSINANAQIIKHQKNQVHRVKNGVKSGEITKGELKVIKHEQKDFRQDVHMAASDGNITPHEKKFIRKEQHQNSRLIYRTKHNNRTRN